MRRVIVLLLALAAPACAAAQPRHHGPSFAPSGERRPLPSPSSPAAAAQIELAPALASSQRDTPEHAAPASADQLEPTAASDPVDADGDDAPQDDAAGVAAQDDDEAAPRDEALDDDVEDEPPPAASSQLAQAPSQAVPPSHAAILKLSDAEFNRRARKDLAALGSVSVGKTNAGALVNGVQLPRGDNWIVVDPGHTWGTQETIDYLVHCIDKVAAAFPDTHKLRIGHISARHGGHLNPHRSHQAGRDVDVGYYYKQGSKVRWYRRASQKNLDVARTWALVRALVSDTDIEFIFINTSIQKLLKAHALSIGEDADWLDSLFQYRSRHPWPLIRHVRGHDTHLHVRFYNPIAQRVGVRAHDALIARGIIKPATQYLRHKARKGDLLGNLAKRYGTTVPEIQRINGLRNTHIRAGKVYLMPKQIEHKVSRPAPVSIPPRRVPPRRAEQQQATR